MIASSILKHARQLRSRIYDVQCVCSKVSKIAHSVLGTTADNEQEIHESHRQSSYSFVMSAVNQFFKLKNSNEAESKGVVHDTMTLQLRFGLDFGQKIGYEPRITAW